MRIAGNLPVRVGSTDKYISDKSHFSFVFDTR